MRRISASLIAGALCFAGLSVLRAADTTLSTVLTLEEAVRETLERNPQILKAREEIKRTQGLIVEVRAQAIPRLSVSSSLQTEDENRFEPGNTPHQQHTWQVEFRVRQAIYAGGKISGAQQIARLSKQAALDRLQTTVDEAVLATRKAFYNVLLNRALITVSEQSVTLLESELSNQQRRYQAGSVPRFNVLRAEVELANAKPTLFRARNNLRIAQAELAKIIARDAPAQNPTQWNFDAQGELLVTPLRYDFAQAREAAFQNRSELRSLNQEIKIQEAQLIVDRGGYLPTLNVFGGYDFLGTRVREFGAENDGYIVGVEGQWNLFDGLETKGKMAQTRARLRSAELDLEDTRRQVELEVRRAHSRWQEATEFIESQRKNVESAEESLRLAQARFDAGAGIQLDVLNSQVSLTQARTNELQARYDYNTALADLERAAGLAIQFKQDQSSVPSSPTITPTPTAVSSPSQPTAPDQNTSPVVDPKPPNPEPIVTPSSIPAPPLGLDPTGQPASTP